MHILGAGLNLPPEDRVKVESLISIKVYRLALNVEESLKVCEYHLSITTVLY